MCHVRHVSYPVCCGLQASCQTGHRRVLLLLAWPPACLFAAAHRGRSGSTCTQRLQITRLLAPVQRSAGPREAAQSSQDGLAVQHAGSFTLYPRNLKSAVRRPLLYISLLFMMFQQFTGINAIVFYAPIIFNSLGKSSTISLENTVIIGAVFVLATAFSMLLVDKFGTQSPSNPGRHPGRLDFAFASFSCHPVGHVVGLHAGHVGHRKMLAGRRSDQLPACQNPARL